jgi:hypothetical protein
MKKIITALFLLSGLLTTQAQSKVRFGLKGGLNISTLTVSGATVAGDISPKVGFHIGGLLAIPVSDRFEIHPELLYSNQGYIYTEKKGGSDLRSVGNINYLAIPVMFAYYPIKKLSVEIGPQISFLLSHKAKVSYSSFDPSEVDFNNVSVDYASTTQSIEVGLNVGLGYKISQNVFASGRYNFGISQANKKVNGSSDNEKDRNSVFQFSLGYLFD